ncbi:tetratricopeptide repeat-containing hybrid sensor histidine kinase/response regulator [Nonlabens tegetincola]|uniref:tetratricopeptide repeat-containing hybrid sensor histidine kinase/response regulator n=1 Tax=Nonlabens tegetincola TaxID=323273 RepID=UPI000A26A2D0|nr:response regulator [Nonlabens tegetincola]
MTTLNSHAILLEQVKISRAILSLLIGTLSCVLCNSQELDSIYEVKTTYTPYQLDSILSRSTDYFKTGQYKKSFELNQFALRHALHAKDLDAISRSYNYLGFDYLQLRDTVRATENFKKSAQYSKQLNNDGATADSYVDLANVYSLQMKTLEMAEDYYKQAIEIYERIGDINGLEYAMYNYADYLIDVERWDEFSKIVLQFEDKEIFPEGVSDDYKALVKNFIGIHYCQNGKTNEAEKYFLEGIKITEAQNNSSEKEMLLQSYSVCLLENNKLQQAAIIQDQYIEILKTNQTNFIEQETAKLAQKYKVEEYQRELDKTRLQKQLQEEQIKNRTILNYVLFGLVAVALLIILILASNFYKRKRIIKQLRKKNHAYLIEKKKAEDLAEVKNNFFSTVSHELRTPLYGVIGLSSILSENNKDVTLSSDLESLKFSADYLLALVNNVLEINKIDHNKIEDEETVFSIRDLVEKIIKTFEYLKRQNNNTLNSIIPDNLPHRVKGNPTRLSQILMNLLGNANKFTENGSIVVELESMSNNGIAHITFKVKDSGTGISKERQQDIFEEFKQGDAHSNLYQGTGLGLPIVKRLLDLSGSEIKLNSDEGKGSTFYFSLDFEIATSSIHEGSTTPIVLENVLKGLKILVAEDNKINQMVTRKILEKVGVQCSVVENGALAIDFYKNNPVDLILMDVNMPVMDGITATQNIRKISDVPIIALTAVEIEEARERIYSSGMNDIIIKPYDIKELKNKIATTIISYRSSK